MAKRQSRKRKMDQNKENVLPSKKRMIRESIKLQEQDWMPTAAVDFYRSENFQKLEDSMKLIDESAVFVGPFRNLKEGLDVNGVDLIMLDREETDLPEMQTFMKCSIGRFAFWRDTPSEKNPVVVLADLQTVPDIKVVGNKVEHAIYSFCSKIKTYKDQSTDVKAAITDVKNLLGTQTMEKEISQVIKKRSAETVTGVGGPGLLVESFNNKKNVPRYRVVKNGTPDIDSLLRCLTKIRKNEQQRVIEIIEVLMGNVMMYNDEGYYGNGLELGHVLFLANQKSVEDKVQMILPLAYSLYKRSDFKEILQLTLELRNN